MKSKHAYNSFYARHAKRALDVALAAPLLVLAAPVYAAVAAAIVVDDGRPVFYRPLRGGYHGKPFRIFKFRTMVKDADRIGGGTTALGDPRITRVGAVLRKTKLDETANLISIVKGDMSFVGPRPELLKYTERYTGDELAILEVRPGVTDFSSLEFISLDEVVGAEDADARYEELVLPRKNALRVRYANEVSLSTDASIFARTVGAVASKALRVLLPKAKVRPNGRRHGVPAASQL